MAKSTKAAPKPALEIVGDTSDLFDEPGSESEPTTIEPPADHTASPVEEPPEGPPPVAARPAPPPEPEPELPPFEVPSDPNYLLAQHQARIAELEAQIQQQAQRPVAPPADPVIERERSLQARRREVRDAHLRAVEEQSERLMRQTMFELQDIDDELRGLSHERQMRDLRESKQRQEPIYDGARAPILQPDRMAQIKAQQFMIAHRVTPQEEAQMRAIWPSYVQKNPGWADPTVDPWHKFDRALKLVRKAPPKEEGFALVEGGQHAQTRRSAASDFGRDEVAKAARQLDMSVADYNKMLEEARRHG